MAKMTQGDFVEWAGKYLHEIMNTLEEKGQQYSKESAFSNFEEGASLNGVNPLEYLMILATKHWHALCKAPDSNTAERAKDIIIYMLLLIAMEEERKK
jgi:hypothetical protein